MNRYFFFFSTINCSLPYKYIIIACSILFLFIIIINNKNKFSPIDIAYSYKKKLDENDLRYMYIYIRFFVSSNEIESMNEKYEIISRVMQRIKVIRSEYQKRTGTRN